jgi:host cell surface-exposed lipoprotein
MTNTLTRTIAAAATGLALAVTGCAIEDAGAEREPRHDVSKPLDTEFDFADKPVKCKWGTVPCKSDQADKTDRADPAEAPLETGAEADARATAESYLDGQAFSRKGLIEQLKYEGFNTKNATYGADAAGADWDQQAVLVAQSYLDGQSFSSAGLIEQLRYEGFTQAQAEYGVRKAYNAQPGGKADKPEGELETASEANARATAESYLDGQAFSRKGLIEQLKYEGFSTKAATYGANAAGADWNEQAVLSAKSYLKGQSFSRSGLVDQLRYEGFTRAQAEHGVKVAYR